MKLPISPAGWRRPTHDQRRRLEPGRSGWQPERGPLDAHRGVAADVSHEVGAHTVRREGQQREARRFDRPGCQHDPERRAQLLPRCQEMLPAVHEKLDSPNRRRSISVKPYDVRAWQQHEAAPGVVVHRPPTIDVFPDRVDEQRGAAVLVETEQPAAGLPLNPD